MAELKVDNLQVTMVEKSKLEEAQRAMRKAEPDYGALWEPLFFTSTKDEYPEFKTLASVTGWKLQADRTKGVWRYDEKKAKQAIRPISAYQSPFKTFHKVGALLVSLLKVATIPLN